MSESIQEAIATLQLELVKAINRFRVKNECLQIAIRALTAYSKCTFDSSVARTALDRIEGLRAGLEEGEG